MVPVVPGVGIRLVPAVAHHALNAAGGRAQHRAIDRHVERAGCRQTHRPGHHRLRLDAGVADGDRAGRGLDRVVAEPDEDLFGLRCHSVELQRRVAGGEHLLGTVAKQSGPRRAVHQERQRPCGEVDRRIRRGGIDRPRPELEAVASETGDDGGFQGHEPLAGGEVGHRADRPAAATRLRGSAVGAEVRRVATPVRLSGDVRCVGGSGVQAGAVAGGRHERRPAP